MSDFRSSVLGALVFVGALVPAGLGQASILKEVLLRIEQMGGGPLAAIMVNLAENVATQMQVDRALQPGERVIVGYDAQGTPVQLTAGVDGLRITAEVAADLSSGLSAGLYSVGSLLYALPPAGQLSLHEQAADGAALQRAQDLLMSRVDGSITNIVNGITLPDLAPVQLAQVYQGRQDWAILDMGRIESTVLGAVNAGEVVTNVMAEWQDGTGVGGIDLALAEIGAGAILSVAEAQSASASALSHSAAELGGSRGNRALILNQASNANHILARVLTVVQSQGLAINHITATAIGAVNAGTVNPALPGTVQARADAGEPVLSGP